MQAKEQYVHQRLIFVQRVKEEWKRTPLSVSNAASGIKNIQEYKKVSDKEIISLFINDLPSAAFFTLTIWPFEAPPPRYPLRWRPHKELCFD